MQLDMEVAELLPLWVYLMYIALRRKKQGTHCKVAQRPQCEGVCFALRRQPTDRREPLRAVSDRGRWPKKKQATSDLASWPLSIRSPPSSNSSDYKLSWYLKPPLSLPSHPPGLKTPPRSRVWAACARPTMAMTPLYEYRPHEPVCVCPSVCVGVGGWVVGGRVRGCLVGFWSQWAFFIVHAEGTQGGKRV